MPGIVGLITRMPPQSAAEQLLSMLASLRHEPFYSVGTWIDESCGIYAGWVIQKNSFCDELPLRNEPGDLVLLFSGEEFPDPELRNRLKQGGHCFDSSGCSYLVHLAEEDGSFPSGLNGRFHGLLANRRDKTVTLFNDRYAMRRLYYHDAREAFYFACEAKAILSVRPELRRLDPVGLGEYIACGAVLESRTLFQGVSVLPPGSAWRFRGGSLEQRRNYFEPRQWEQQGELDLESYYRQLQQVFACNLPRYFTGRQKIAMSLTGGIDTRMIMAVRRPAPDSLPCYTFGSMFRENQDVRVSRRIAQTCGQSHKVITADGEFLSRFAHYAERAVYLSDGCVDVSRSPDLYLNQRAREIAPVRMTGNYGGEILRQVRSFKVEKPPADLFNPEVLRSIERAKQIYSEIEHGHPVSFAVFQQARYSQYGILALEETQLSMRSPFLDNDFVATIFRSPKWALANNDVSLRLIADASSELSRVRTDRGIGGSRHRLTALPSRAALEFLFKAEYAYDMGMPQWLARVNHALKPLHLEYAFLGRHKPFHFRIWYRDALAGYIQEMLLDKRSLSRPYVERKQLEHVVMSHIRGRENHTNELHKILALELLCRVLLENREFGSAEEMQVCLAALNQKSSLAARQSAASQAFNFQVTGRLT